jgi:hypothetical protein
MSPFVTCAGAPAVNSMAKAPEINTSFARMMVSSRWIVSVQPSWELICV